MWDHFSNEFETNTLETVIYQIVNLKKQSVSYLIRYYLIRPTMNNDVWGLLTLMDELEIGYNLSMIFGAIEIFYIKIDIY